ncbi:MAG: hypothetical protein KJ051_04205 [Thermoleophilia bacterium]|nr:hypothetical protein [Thermoleophilia bacterium]
MTPDREQVARISFVLTEPPEDARVRFEARIDGLEARIEDSRRCQKASAAPAKAVEA